MCLTRDLLARFYGSLDFSLRALIHYRVMTALGRPFDYFLVEEPWRALEVLERALGRHNAELLLNMLAEWLRRNGCVLPREQLARYLSSREAWGGPRGEGGGVTRPARG
jgi:GNAT superfamily N-acetyltransferase